MALQYFGDPYGRGYLQNIQRKINSLAANIFAQNVGVDHHYVPLNFASVRGRGQVAMTGLLDIADSPV